jgi:hypothetical protein
MTIRIYISIYSNHTLELHLAFPTFTQTTGPVRLIRERPCKLRPTKSNWTDRQIAEKKKKKVKQKQTLTHDTSKPRSKGRRQEEHTSYYMSLTSNALRFLTTMSYMCMDLNLLKSLGREMRWTVDRMWN